MITFAEPLWLIAGLAAVIGLALFFRHLEKQRRAALQRFVAHQLIDRLTANISTTRRRAKNLLMLTTVLLAFVALARPQYGERWVDVKRKGIDLLFALDTSKSMLAEDVKPNRLKRAHLAILDFVRQLGGDRVGLLPFAGTAYLMCPLTLDYDAFEESLAAVNTDLIPQGGTNLAGVIDKAVEVLDNAANHKLLIIITDGESLEGDALAAAAKAAAKGLIIHTVGVGTESGEMIPLAGSGGRGFVKDPSGNYVTSRLDEASLAAIADRSGGLYAPLGAGEGLDTIYREKLALIPREEVAERRHKVPIERFEWPLALAAILLVVETLVGERKGSRSRSLRQALGRLIKKKTPALVLLLLLMPLATRSVAADGEDAYRRGDYLAASEYYGRLLEKSPEDAQLQYNFGTAAYKNQMYDDAIEAFTKALQSEDIELQKKAYYNRGNSHYQKGVEMRSADPRATAEQWRQALDSLQSVLELNPADQDAGHNREMVAKQLARLEEELQQQQQNQADQQQDGDQQEDRQQRNQQGQAQSPQEKTQSPQEQGAPQDGQNAGEAGQQAENPAGKPEGGGDRQEPARDDTGNASQPAEVADQGDQGDQGDQADRRQATPAAQAARDAERRQLGKMTREEAERMLNALKQEEGELNFVPSGRPLKETGRDW